MDLTRRKFLKILGGTTVGAVVFQACGVPEKELLIEAPLEMPEDMVTGIDNWYATVCTECNTPEGIVVRVMEGRAKKVEGNVDYPVNIGKHSGRCEGSLQGLYNPDRISSPLLRVGARGEGRWEEISWTDAIARVAHQLGQVEDMGSVVLSTDPVNGHLNKLIKSFVSKTGITYLPYENIDSTNLRRSIEDVFGQPQIPEFDIANCQYLLSFGADFLSTWVSPVRYGKAYGEFRQGDRKRGRHVHIESRLSTTAASADEWIYVNPGWEGHVALSIAQVIISEGRVDSNVVKSLTGDGKIDLDKFSPENISDGSGVNPETIRHVAEEFATNNPAIALGGGSAGASTNGFDNLKSIYSLNHLVGSVSAEGGVVLNPDSPFNDVPVNPDISSFKDWIAFTAKIRSEGISALMLRGSNPVYGMPESSGFKDALLGKNGEDFNVPLIVSFSGIMDDTSALADIILPENHGLEDWGDQLPNPGPGYQTVGVQQPVVRPFFESRGNHLGTRNFGDSIIGLAHTLEIDLGLGISSFKELLELGIEELYKKANGSVRAENVKSFWNGVLQRGGWWDINSRYKGDEITPKPLPENLQKPEVSSGEFALVPYMSIGITDGSGAHLPWLQAMTDPITTAAWQTWIEINNKVADRMDIKEGDVLELTSSEGQEILGLAYPHPGVSPNVIAVPMGQGHTEGGRYSKDRGANVMSMLGSVTDSTTGSFAWAATRVNVKKTGDWTRVPRFENTAPDLSTDKNHHVIKFTSDDD